MLHAIHIALHLNYVAFRELHLWNEVSISIDVTPDAMLSNNLPTPLINIRFVLVKISLSLTCYHIYKENYVCRSKITMTCVFGNSVCSLPQLNHNNDRQ